MTDTLEQTARRIADRGRDELVARLRPAFEEAAREHAELLQLNDEQLEEMVQRAADRADGLQWRRALAGVATEELRISLGEALEHPAVAQAHAMVSAPSYEDSLAELRRRARKRPASARPAAEAAGAPARPEPAPAEPEPAPARPEPAPAEPEPGRPEVAEPEAAEPDAAEPDAAATDDGWLRLDAVHLGGIANLEAAEGGIELRLSADGLDIARAGDQVLGRLRWPEIQALDVPPSRGLRRRRRSAGAQLVIRTDHGDASFEVPEVSSDELEEQLEPLLRRYASR